MQFRKILQTLTVFSMVFFCFSGVLAEEQSFRCGVAELREYQPDVNWAALRASHRGMNRSRAEYQVGDSRLFWTWDLSVMPPVDVQLSFTCRAKGTSSYIWVADDQWEVSVTQAEVDGVFSAWEDQTPQGSLDPEKGIYDIATTVFGPAPDELDQDPRIHILFFDVGSFHGYTFDGFFNAYDQMTDAEAQAEDRHSNECEIVNLDCDPQQPASDYMLGVLAHEFQHMIHWAGDVNEDTWINEGCSQLSWYLCGYETDGDEANFADHPNNDLTAWDESGDYGQVALFFIYLYEQFGVSAWASIVSDPANGFAGLTNGFNGLGHHFDPDEVFSNWCLANYFNDPTWDHGIAGYTGIEVPAFRISTSYATYPTGQISTNSQKWAARAYRFTGGSGQLNLEYEAGTNNVRTYAVIQTPTSARRVIPFDPVNQKVQLTGFGTDFTTLDLVIVAGSSEMTPVSYVFSADTTASADVSPPYPLEWTPFGLNVMDTSASIVLRDEMDYVDPSTVIARINGTVPSDPLSLEVTAETNLEVTISLAGIAGMTPVDLAVTAADPSGNQMDWVHFYFSTGDRPALTTGVRLEMPAHLFNPGDPCSLTAHLTNAGLPVSTIPVFVILDAFGSYFCAPSFQSLESGIDLYYRDLSTGGTSIEVISAFDWPSGTGNVPDGLFFYGAMTTVDMTALWGEMDQWEFGWSN